MKDVDGRPSPAMTLKFNASLVMPGFMPGIHDFDLRK
jgi:hypothetical protein